MDPGFPEAHALLGLAYSINGQHEEAVSELRKIKDLENNPAYLSWLGYVYGMGGRKEEAQAVATQLGDLSSRTYVSPLWMTIFHIGLQDNDGAFQWLERVFEERAGGGAVSLKVNPVFDNLRSDPRFADFLRRSNFTP
jgi:tetratricopeptide (TPR) repeat protein